MSAAHAAGPARSLRDQLVLESEAMVRYALASGLDVPAAVVDVVEKALAERRPDRAVDVAGGESAEPTASRSAGRDGGARREIVALTRAHDELVRLVSPATPRTILLLAEGRKSRLSFLGPVRLVRHMLIVVIVLLAGFIVLAMSPEVNTRSGDVFTSSGISLLINELFFLAAGGLGAAFAGLFTAYRYISAGTYDPKYESTYWVRFILGLMAGVILPALIPLGGGEEASGLTKPLLALLGGFSASVLYQILDRLVQSVETLVQAGSRDLRAAEREMAAARELERKNQERVALVGDLLRLRDEAKAGSDPQRLADEVERVVQGLVPTTPAALAEVTGDDPDWAAAGDGREPVASVEAAQLGTGLSGAPEPEDGAELPDTDDVPPVPSRRKAGDPA